MTRRDPNARGDNRLTYYVVPVGVLVLVGLLAYDLASLLFLAMDALMGGPGDMGARP